MNLLKGLENLNKFLILATLTIHSLIWPNTGYSEAINYRNDFIISDLPRINDHLDHRTVIDVAIDPSGSLWILNIDGVFVYNGAILHYIFDLEILHQNFENMYDVRFSESQENIVLFDKSRSLNIETETFSLSKPDYINLASSCIKPKISAERHIVQTDDNGCWTHLIIDSLGVLPVKDMTTLGHSVDAFATQNGLIIYSEKHGYSLLNSSNSTLFDSDVTAVTADSTNNLIIGTYSGIQVLKLKDFSFLSRNFMGKDLNSITKVEDFENGEIAVLTIDHLAIFDDDWSIKASVPVPQTAMAIAKSKESIIVGGTGKRHCVLDIHSQPYKCDPSQKLGEINGISSLLYYESWDRIIGTSIEGQIFSIEPKTTNLSQILTLDRNTVFLEPFGDSVFITGGIDNLAITKIEFVDTDTWNVTPIKSWNVSNVIFYDALIYENSLFIATSEGLAEINIADFRNMSASDLLKQRLVTGKHIFSVEQNSEFVAFTSADRIHLANKENLSTLEAELVLKDLVRNFEFDFGVSKVIGESLVFGGSAGLAIIAGSITPTPPPKLNFTSFAVKGEQMKIAAPLHQIQDITLPHDAYRFSAGFAVMDYINPNRSVYKYKLEGLDDDWIDGGNTPSATYTNLSPGTIL